MNRIPAFALLIVILVDLSPGATTQPATQPSPQGISKTLDQLKNDKRQQLASQNRPFRLLDPAPMDQLIHFRVFGNSLVVDSPIFKDRGINGRIPLVGSDNIATVRINTIKDFPGTHSLSFDVYDFSNPDLIDRHLQILSLRWILNMAEDKEYVDRTETVSLTETIDPGAPAPITLRVQIIPYSDQISSVNVPYNGDSLWSLRCAHPGEVERFMRPLFRDFNQESAAFNIEDKAAWQVMSDTWTPPPGLPDKIRSILNQLNADDYAARDGAQKQLESIGEPAALYLLSASLPPLTPEQQARLEKFLAPYRMLSDAQTAIFRHDTNFLLDCLYNDDAALRTAALDHLGRIVGRPIKFDTDLPLSQRVIAIRTLRDELSPQSTTNPSSP